MELVGCRGVRVGSGEGERERRWGMYLERDGSEAVIRVRRLLSSWDSSLSLLVACGVVDEGLI